jgi:hypothetical protein
MVACKSPAEPTPGLRTPGPTVVIGDIDDTCQDLSQRLGKIYRRAWQLGAEPQDQGNVEHLAA